MKLFTHPTLFKILILLIFLNTIILFGSQYFVYTKHWDLYWFSSFFYRELLLCVSYFAFFWILSLLPFGVYVAWAIFGISIICFVVDIFLLYTFDTNLNSYLVIVALETNPQESAEFLHNYVSFGLLGVYAFFIIVAVLLWAKIPFLQPSIKLKKFMRFVYMWFVVSVCIVFAMIFTHTKPLNEDWSDMLYNYTKQFYRAIQGTYGFMKEYEKLNSKFDELSTTLQVKKAKNNIQNIVLVIGESTQRDKLHLYGYPLPTTPNLDSIKQHSPKNLLVFSDIISAHGQTHESLSLSLTLANQDNTQGIQTIIPKHKPKATKSSEIQKPWYEYINVIDAFKLGGYHTIAISNQEPVSLFGNAAATILKRADEAHFVNVNDKMSTTKFDEAILDIFDEELGVGKEQVDLQGDFDNGDSKSLSSSENPPQEPKNTADSKDSKPTFYALHLMGNHAKYYNRYPSSFARFSQEDMLCRADSVENLAATSAEENMHYDNSVLYGDFVLSEIIERFENTDSLVLYFSDHGEEIYDWRNFIGHSDSKMSRFMVEIPFIIYVSDEFIAKHTELYKRLQKAQNQRYMNDDLIHTLLDIAGIDMQGFESKRSLMSNDKTLLNKRIRLVGEKKSAKDYDKELKAQKSYYQQGLCKKGGEEENKE